RVHAQEVRKRLLELEEELGSRVGTHRASSKGRIENISARSSWPSIQSKTDPSRSATVGAQSMPPASRSRQRTSHLPSAAPGASRWRLVLQMCRQQAAAWRRQ